MNRPARFPSWLWPVLWWSGIVAVAIAIGQYATAPAGPRGFPRIAAPADFRTLLYVVGVGSVVWYGAAVAAPLLAWGARHLRPDRDGWFHTIAISAAAIVALAIAVCVVQYFTVYGGAASRPALSDYVSVLVPQQLLAWAALSGLIAGSEGRRRAGHSAIERERLRAQLAEQRLIALTAQLHPHFLFNTLQGVSTLIHRDPDGADELLTKLSDLLRDVLRHRDQVLVPLSEELQFARTYLEIAQLRFGDRLSFAIDAADGVGELPVPVFILQPLIENAVAHGIGGSLDGGSVTIRVRRHQGRLQVEVSDNGAGLPAGPLPREGLGLSNTRERLRAIYGERFDLRLVPGEIGGAVAVVDLPIGAAS